MKKMVRNEKLPKATLFAIRFHGWWIRQMWEARNLDKRHRPFFFMRTRGANYAQCWIGPFDILWRRPWLEGPARASHPEAFK